MASTAPTSRVREKPGGDEEATADLKLGEFQSVPTLSLSEARLLINAIVENRKSAQLEDNETFKKTMEYLDTFARFQQKENIEAVEQMLARHPELAAFERSQLGTLCCETAEEAKTLIPSVSNKISDADLQELLDDMNRLRALGQE